MQSRAGGPNTDGQEPILREAADRDGHLVGVLGVALDLADAAALALQPRVRFSRTCECDGALSISAGEPIRGGEGPMPIRRKGILRLLSAVVGPFRDERVERHPLP